MERPYQRPVPGPREVRTPHHPGGGGADAAGARAHTHPKGKRGLPEGQPDGARGTHRPRLMAYQRARVRDTRTRRPATRSAGHAGREGGNGRDTTPGTDPSPPNRPRAPRTHGRGTAPAKAVVAHCATPQPPGKVASAPAQGGPTGEKPVARARRRRRPGRPHIRGATRGITTRSHGCELMHWPGSGETGKPGRDGAPGPVNPGDSATRQEVRLGGPPTRTRSGEYHLARPGGPRGRKASSTRKIKPRTSNLPAGQASRKPSLHPPAESLSSPV